MPPAAPTESAVFFPFGADVRLGWKLLEVVAVYYQQRFCLLSLPEFARILLTIEEKARHKLRKKMRQFEKNLDDLLNNARPP